MERFAKNSYLEHSPVSTQENFLIFQEKELSYISGNANPKKSLIFQEVTFRARKFFLLQE